jgi:hypothetical protein
MRALSWGRSSVYPFCHSCVTLALSSLWGIWSTLVRSVGGFIAGLLPCGGEGILFGV